MAEGLQKYIKEQKKQGKKLWGGIAIESNGSWFYNNQPEYIYTPNNLSNTGWKLLNF